MRQSPLRQGSLPLVMATRYCLDVLRGADSMLKKKNVAIYLKPIIHLSSHMTRSTGNLIAPTCQECAEICPDVPRMGTLG